MWVLEGGEVVGNGDVNADGGLHLSDAVYLLAFLFQGGPMPHSCPSTGPTEDDCTNGVDDDLDGATDCVDTDCLP